MTLSASYRIPDEVSAWRTRLVPISLGMLGVSFMMLGLFLVGTFQTTIDGCAIALASFVMVLLIVRSDELRNNPVHPLAFVLVLLILNYPVRAIVLEYYRLQLAYIGQPLEHLAEACVLIAIAAVLFYLGYSWRLGVRLAQKVPLLVFPGRDIAVRSLVVRVTGFYVLGWLIRAYLLSNGIFHLPGEIQPYLLRYLSLLQDVAQFCTLAYVTLASLVVQKKVGIGILVPFVGGEILFGLLYGGASAPASPLVLLAVLYSLYRRPWRWSEIVAAILVVLLIYAPLSLTWRDSYFFFASNKTPGLSALEHSMDEAATVAESGGERERQQWRVLERFGQLDYLMVVLDRVPRMYPYQEGDTFLTPLLVQPIPRVLWPNKPVIDLTRRFAVLFGDDPTDVQQPGTHISIGNVGELYYNFGYWGVLLCPIYGVVIRFFWERTRYCLNTEIGGAMRIPFLLFQVASVHDAIADYIVSLIRGPVVLYCSMILLHARMPVPVRLGRLGANSLDGQLKRFPALPRVEPGTTRP